MAVRPDRLFQGSQDSDAYTCSACVQECSEVAGPPAKVMKVVWQDGDDLAVRDVQVMNPQYEIGEQDVHAHRAPRSPSYPPGP